MSEITHRSIQETISEGDPMGDLVNARDRFSKATGVLPGTGTDGPAPAPAAIPAAPAQPPTLPVDEEWAIPEDPEGDAPLRPAWTRTLDGVQARRRYAQRQALRRSRRWVRRQSSVHGAVPRAVRGVRRTHDWIAGTEGISAQAAGEHARMAAVEARKAARTARMAVLGTATKHGQNRHYS